MKYSVRIISEKFVDNNKLYNILIGEKTVYLYLVDMRGSEQSEVYIISEKNYKSMINGSKLNSDSAEKIGVLGYNESLEEWIIGMQKKKKKVFGKIKDTSSRNAGIILLTILILGLSSLGFGIWRTSYKKILESRMGSTEGTVTSYSKQIRNGSVMQGLYTVQVKYQVDGVTYKGYNGTTGTEPKVGNTMIVQYDTKHPENIIVLDEMGERTILFIVIGGAISVVAFSLLVSNSSHKTKKKG